MVHWVEQLDEDWNRQNVDRRGWWLAVLSCLPEAECGHGCASHPGPLLSYPWAIITGHLCQALC